MTSQKEEMPENGGDETPVIDLSDAAVNQLIRSAKKRGYVTHGQINELLSVEEMKPEQIEDMLAKLNGTERASRRWSSSSMILTSVLSAARAVCCGWPRATVSNVWTSSKII